MSSNLKGGNTNSSFSDAKRDLERLRGDVACLEATIDKSLQLATAMKPNSRDLQTWSVLEEETRELAEMVANPAVKVLLLELAHIQDRVLEARRR